MFILYKEKGFTVFLAIILILVVVLVIISGIGLTTLNNIKDVRNAIYSIKSYYVAEAGIEDSLLRLLDPDMEVGNSYSLVVGQVNANIEISKDPISASQTIISQGDASNRIRKVKTLLIITATEESFHYGVQVGDGGLTMDSNSQIDGNVYSNGPIIGSSNTKILGDAYSASSTGQIDRVRVLRSDPGVDDGNAHANTISNSYIQNGAYYQTIIETTANRYFPGSPDPEPEQMPISEEEITDWKNTAASGGVISSYTLGGNDEASIGPVKINGDLTVTSNAILTITGTIWVTGDVLLDSNIVLQLDSAYGELSDVIVADGTVFIDSNVQICGSEGYNKSTKGCNASVGSYLMILSTNSSLDPGNPAILAKSNTATAVLYTNQGVIVLESNAHLKEATAYALYLSSNAEVTYDIGLTNALFTSGPSGGWQVTEWEEIE